jgi:altronate dehydratase large subunit
MAQVGEITGYKREDGSIGIRNHVLVLSTVACVNGVVQRISREVPQAVCVTHAQGCGRSGKRDRQIASRILSGLMQHPNIGGVVLIGLGCEYTHTSVLLPKIGDHTKPIEIFNLQEHGGSLKTTQLAVSAVRRMLSTTNRQKRQKCSWQDLLISSECGGSDALSGITANVAIGAVSDWAVAQGATVMFSENTEMIGTAHILQQRALNQQVAKQIGEMVSRAEEFAVEILGDSASRLITPGNMEGGMSTIAEKSMGCIAKGGTTTINQVVDYGERPTAKGLVLQDGPGYDIDSMAGLAASGSQLMLFSTGRGTPAGFPGVPVIKIASNSRLFETMRDDMDLNAGPLVEGKSLEEIRDESIDLLVRVINGEKTKAESNQMEVFSFMTMDPPM